MQPNGSRQVPKDAFEQFVAAFPQRTDGMDAAAARGDWESAVRRASAETILDGARAYRKATEGRERRYVMGARRWLREGRWRDARTSRPLVFVPADTAAWRAWSDFYKATRGKSPPQSRRGGWWFPQEFPPGLAAAE